MALSAIILAILTFFMLLPFCAELSCDDGKISASVKLFKIPIYIYPKRNKSDKKKKEKKLELHDKLEIIKIILKMIKKFSLNEFRLRFISAGDDPYDAVMKYSSANAIAGFFYQFINTENTDIVINTDFNAQKSEFSAFLGLELRLYKLIFSAPAAAKGLFNIYTKPRRMKNGKQTQ